jgi:hypothetical protein
MFTYILSRKEFACGHVGLKIARIVDAFENYNHVVFLRIYSNKSWSLTAFTEIST